MESGIDPSGLYYVGIVLAVVAPLVFIAFALGRIRGLRPVADVAAQAPRPGYRWGIATGAGAALVVPAVLRLAGAPDWASSLSVVVLLLSPLAINPFLSKTNWFASGMPWGVLIGWLLLPMLFALAMLGIAGLAPGL